MKNDHYGLVAGPDPIRHSLEPSQIQLLLGIATAASTGLAEGADFAVADTSPAACVFVELSDSVLDGDPFALRLEVQSLEPSRIPCNLVTELTVELVGHRLHSSGAKSSLNDAGVRVAYLKPIDLLCQILTV